MNFSRTEFAIEAIQNYIEASGAEDLVIENFFAQYLLICIYSEIEQNVKEIFRERMIVDEDHSLRDFLYNASEGIINRVSKSDLSDTVKLFGEDAIAKFNGSLLDIEVQQYGRIIVNRHKASHQSGVDMTLDEVKRSLNTVKKVVSAFETSIA